MFMICFLNCFIMYTQIRCHPVNIYGTLPSSNSNFKKSMVRYKVFEYWGSSTVQMGKMHTWSDYADIMANPCINMNEN